MFLVHVKTSLVQIISLCLFLRKRIIKSDMQMEPENTSLFRLMPRSYSRVH